MVLNDLRAAAEIVVVDSNLEKVVRAVKFLRIQHFPQVKISVKIAILLEFFFVRTFAILNLIFFEFVIFIFK